MEMILPLYATMGIIKEKSRHKFMAIPKQQTKNRSLIENDWTLNPEQMLFLMQNHNTIETAYAEDNLEFLRAFASSDEFVALFSNMGFDEAYDRYETMLETDDAT